MKESQVSENEHDSEGFEEEEEEEDVEEEAYEDEDIGRKIFTEKSDTPINSLADNYRAGDLILDPHFQRRQVWDYR